jgi:hypothetical protein
LNGTIAPSTVAQLEAGSTFRHGVSLPVFFFLFFFSFFSDLLFWSEIPLSFCRRWTASYCGRVVAMIDTVVVILVILFFHFYFFFFLFFIFVFVLFLLVILRWVRSMLKYIMKWL